MARGDLLQIEDAVFNALRPRSRQSPPTQADLGLVLAKLLALEAIVRGMLEGQADRELSSSSREDGAK